MIATMFEYYNPHPKGIKTCDCVVRAISTATGKDYLECRRELNRLKRETGEKSYKTLPFLKKYLSRYSKISLQPGKGGKRVRGINFTELYPKGTYILNMKRHLVACVDGKILDIWDSSDRIIYSVWIIS